jgi:hypothetical protein
MLFKPKDILLLQIVMEKPISKDSKYWTATITAHTKQLDTNQL